MSGHGHSVAVPPRETVMADQEIRFVGWRLARAGGSPWRRIVDVERDGEHLGEAEACLTAAAAAAVATDLDREPTDDEVAAALMSYTESHLRDLLERGEDLSDHSLIIEVDSIHRDLLLPYLQP
jgi:hypothetical protein